MKSKEVQLGILKLCALVLAVSAILMLALFSLGRTSATAFWIVIIVAALVGYFILPPVRRKIEAQ